MIWTSEEIQKATGGKLHGKPCKVTSVTIDSRLVKEGTLFVALKGEKRNGHDFVKEALAKGAVAALVQTIPAGTESSSLIVVADVYEALVDLARAARARTQATIVAVTGSVGKTGTKEAIALAAKTSRKVYATSGNLNNHLGLPLSLVNMPTDTTLGVFELGMNHAGEIAFLTKIARPHIAVITNVESVHLEFFSGLEGIADAKAEIMQGIEPGGAIILNRDNPFFDHLYAKAKACNAAHVLTFGADAHADCRLLSYTTESFGSAIEANIRGTQIVYKMGTIGEHWAYTSLAALAAVTTAGVDLADAAAAFAHFHEPAGRGKVQRVRLPQGDITLIDDSYNASPASMRAAIAKLEQVHAAQGGKGRKVAVLGDMLELGASASELHYQLAYVLEQYHVDQFFAVGTLMQHAYNAVPNAMHGGSAADITALLTEIASKLKADDVVLLKGSHSIAIDKLRDSLIQTSSATKEPIDAL